MTQLFQISKSPQSVIGFFLAIVVINFSTLPHVRAEASGDNWYDWVTSGGSYAVKSMTTETEDEEDWEDEDWEEEDLEDDEQTQGACGNNWYDWATLGGSCVVKSMTEDTETEEDLEDNDCGTPVECYQTAEERLVLAQRQQTKNTEIIKEQQIANERLLKELQAKLAQAQQLFKEQRAEHERLLKQQQSENQQLFKEQQAKLVQAQQLVTAQQEQLAQAQQLIQTQQAKNEQLLKEQRTENERLLKEQQDENQRFLKTQSTENKNIVDENQRIASENQRLIFENQNLTLAAQSMGLENPNPESQCPKQRVYYDKSSNWLNETPSSSYTTLVSRELTLSAPTEVTIIGSGYGHTTHQDMALYVAIFIDGTLFDRWEHPNYQIGWGTGITHNSFWVPITALAALKLTAGPHTIELKYRARKGNANSNAYFNAPLMITTLHCS